MDGIAAPVLAHPDDSDYDGAVDAIQFALDKPPTIGYTRSVWQSAEDRRGRGPVGRLVLHPAIRWAVERLLPRPALGRGGDESARTGKTFPTQALPIRCKLSRPGGSAVLQGPNSEKEFFFCANNAGMSMKKKDRHGKRGRKAGMFMKTKVVMCLRRECI